jgi:ubiquinone/menaquinone biosynthesis C-methylase UbiE
MYYMGRRARNYNARWYTFNERTLGEALAMIDFAALRSVPERLGRSPRVLDVACGTGILLKELLERVPGVKAYGVDASEDMLALAYAALKGHPHVHLECVLVGAGETVDLPYAKESFDLITCTNALHDILDAVATLAGLKQRLSPGGQLVVEDFARREHPFPWTAFEWLLQQIEGGRVHAYTLAEAQSVCKRAGLYVASGKVFTVDWLWHGWALRAYGISSVSG